MISLKRVLVTTDFSSCSAKALEYACAFAEKFGAELHILHVLEDLGPLLPVSGMGVPALTEAMRDIRTKAEQTLATMPDAAWCAGKTVVRALRNGTPHHEIAGYAKETNADLIVLGTHGRTGLTHILLGSVAEKVVRHAPCPVLTVHLGEREFVKK